MKRVCIFADFPISAIEGEFVGHGGGQGATWLPQLVEALAIYEDLEIHWCVFDKGRKDPKKLETKGQIFHLIPSLGVTLSLLSWRLIQRRAAKRLICELSPDVVHCWGSENLSGVAVSISPEISIFSMQGIVTHILKVGGGQGWRWALFAYFERRSLAKAAMVTSESQWGLDRVAEIIQNERTAKVEYGVFQGYYETEWNPLEEEPRILFAGRLTFLKGVDILLKVIENFRSRNWKIAFAGGGEFEERLRQLNDPKVELLGVLKTRELQKEMAKSWALVHPTRADTSPNVVKEARVIGLPVIVSPNGGQAEYVENGVDGLVVNGEDPERWFQAMDEILSDFEKCRQMGKVNHEHYRDYFRVEKTASQFADIYRSISLFN